MLDYQRIVDEVRGALFNNADTSDDLLQAAASDYSLAIDEANQRLSACGGLLRKGLRSEAIQLCEVEPNLLDIVETLDFPERDSWNELLALRGLAAPAPLMLEAAGNLNEAYAIEQPLAALLQRHRLLAMSRGPLRFRVDTLRSLADADPDNTVWEQDLAQFEEARLKELQREVPQAIAAGDSDALNSLTVELENPAWRIGRPEVLIQQITVARQNAARLQGLKDLRRAAEQLAAMHVAFDIDGGRAARAEWEQLFAAWGQFAGQPLLETVADPLEWLRQQDEIEAQAARHSRAVAALLKAVAAHRPADELQRLRREAGREGDVPESADRCYREEINSQERAARRRSRITAAVIAAFILATGGIVAFVVVQHLREAQVDRDAAALQRLVDDGQSDQAREFIEQLTARSPRSAADPRVREIAAQFAKRAKDEDDRRKEFEREMLLVEKSVADKLPDTAALGRAQKLATGDEETMRVRKAEQDFAKVASEIQSKSDQEFLAQLKLIRQRVDEIEKQGEANPDGTTEKLVHIEQELSALVAAATQVGEAAKQPAGALRDRLKSLEENARTARESLNLEDAVTAACGDNEAFRRVLIAYAAKSPHARRSESFRAVATGEPPLWEWLDQWNRTVRSIGRANCSTVQRKAAADMAGTLQKTLEDRDGHPDAEAFRQRMPYLAAIAHRSEGGNPIEEALEPPFADPLVVGAWVLKAKSGRRYYLLEDPAAKFGPLASWRQDGNYGIKYVVSFDLAKKSVRLQGMDIDTGDTVAPQRKTGKALTASLEGLSDGDWEQTFCRMVEIVLKDSESDALLKHSLLRKILDTGCRGSLCLEKGFSAAREVLGNSAISSTTNWMDPDDADAHAQRSLAETDLGKLAAGFKQAQNDTARQWKSLAARIGHEYTCVGWLRRDASGDWQCRTRPNCRATGDLFVLRSNEQGQRAVVFDPVGRAEHGAVRLVAASRPAFAEGRPVYVVAGPP